MRPTIPALSALLLAACVDKGPDTGDETGESPAWTVVAEGHPAAFLSVWGSTAADVWAVGADAGGGPAVVHYDGSAWAAVDTGTRGDLWWVTSAGGDTVWMGGADGRVLRHARGSGVTEEHVLDPALTVFGVWAAADDDVWAVGGDIDASGDASQVWHWDGAAWARATLPPAATAALAIYKVWGRSSTDVWAVGTGGVGLHWDGAAWSTFDTGTTRNLYTIHGTDVALWAVGGFGTGTLVTSSGGAWTDETPDLAPQLNGIDASGPAPLAVGSQGSVYTRGADGWAADPRGAVTAYDLHSVWGDPDGGVWAVGGKLASFPLDNGIVAYGGDAVVAPL